MKIVVGIILALGFGSLIISFIPTAPITIYGVKSLSRDLWSNGEIVGVLGIGVVATLLSISVLLKVKWTYFLIPLFGAAPDYIYQISVILFTEKTIAEFDISNIGVVFLTTCLISIYWVIMYEKMIAYYDSR